MKKIWLRFLPVLALCLLAWLIIKYLKPEVYDIELPEKIHVWSHNVVIQDSAGRTFINTSGFDSFSTSKGLAAKAVQENMSIKEVIRLPQSLPLEWVILWKGGFKYIEPLYANGHAIFNENKPGVFKENYDERKITLGLEKKMPMRILALWESFIIAGETNGELIKLQIPACATKFEFSEIRVWCCDSFNISTECKIPLYRGSVVSGNMGREIANKETGILRFYNTLNIINAADSITRRRIIQSMYKLIENPDLNLCLTFGDERLNSQTETFGMLGYNYFGKKIICVWNKLSQPNNLRLPVKGDLKHTAGSTNFKQVGSEINIHLPPNGFEIIY